MNRKLSEILVIFTSSSLVSFEEHYLSEDSDFGVIFKAVGVSLTLGRGDILAIDDQSPLRLIKYQVAIRSGAVTHYMEGDKNAPQGFLLSQMSGAPTHA